MSEFNFDKLKNLEIPDTWVDGALEVPPCSNKPPVIFVNLKRVITAVACLLVVCVLSIPIFIYTQKSDILSAQPTVVTPTETQNAGLNTDSTKNTEPAKSNEENTEPTKTEETEDSTENVNPIEMDTETETTASSKTESSNGETNPDKIPTNPQGSIDTNPDGVIREPDGGNEKPNSSTSKPSTTDPDKIPSKPAQVKLCRGSFLLEKIQPDLKVYCSVHVYYDDELIGDKDLFSDQHIADISRVIEDAGGDIVVAKYDPVKLGLIKQTEMYRFYFYNSKGEILFQDVIHIDID